MILLILGSVQTHSITMRGAAQMKVKTPLSIGTIAAEIVAESDRAKGVADRLNKECELKGGKMEQVGRYVSTETQNLIHMVEAKDLPSVQKLIDRSFVASYYLRQKSLIFTLNYQGLVQVINTHTMFPVINFSLPPPPRPSFYLAAQMAEIQDIVLIFVPGNFLRAINITSNSIEVIQLKTQLSDVLYMRPFSEKEGEHRRVAIASQNSIQACVLKDNILKCGQTMELSSKLLDFQASPIANTLLAIIEKLGLVQVRLTTGDSIMLMVGGDFQEVVVGDALVANNLPVLLQSSKKYIADVLLVICKVNVIDGEDRLTQHALHDGIPFERAWLRGMTLIRESGTGTEFFVDSIFQNRRGQQVISLQMDASNILLQNVFLEDTGLFQNYYLVHYDDVVKFTRKSESVELSCYFNEEMSLEGLTLIEYVLTNGKVNQMNHPLTLSIYSVVRFNYFWLVLAVLLAFFVLAACFLSSQFCLKDLEDRLKTEIRGLRARAQKYRSLEEEGDAKLVQKEEEEREEPIEVQ